MSNGSPPERQVSLVGKAVAAEPSNTSVPPCIAGSYRRSPSFIPTSLPTHVVPTYPMVRRQFRLVIGHLCRPVSCVKSGLLGVSSRLNRTIRADGRHSSGTIKTPYVGDRRSRRERQTRAIVPCHPLCCKMRYSTIFPPEPPTKNGSHFPTLSASQCGRCGGCCASISEGVEPGP